MTTTTLTMVGMPPARPFSSDECAALVRAGIIDAREQADALAGRHRFTVDEYLAMERAGILYKSDRVELIDGVIVLMPPIGDRHTRGANWANTLFVPPLIGRATVQMGGPIYLNDNSAPQPDVALVQWDRPGSGATGHATPDNVYLVIEFADSSLAYYRGAKLARYAAAGIPEVWVANLRAREVTSYAEPNGAEYAAVNTYRVGDTISPRAFPDVVLAVSDFMPPASETS
jgi:Uma2 family endonuclease